MSDQLPETTTPPPDESTTPPPANTPEARTETGELKSAPTTTPTEPQPKPEGEGGKGPKDPSATGAPEAYADFKAPEGYTIDKAVVDKAAPIFKELNLSQDQAQRLVDFYASTQTDAAKSGEAAYNAMREGWRGEVLKDTTLSTGNALKPEVSQAIARTIDALPAPLATQFREQMNITGVGDNPAFVRAMFELSKFVTEGRPVSGKGPASTGQAAPDAKPKSIASAMFPNLP